MVRLQAGRLKNCGSIPGRVKKFSFQAFGPALGSTQPSVQLAPGTLSSAVKRLGCEADCSPPSGVEIKNMWSCTSIQALRSWNGAYFCVI